MVARAGLVARVTRDARLRVVVSASEPNGSTSAKLNLIPLLDDPAGIKLRASRPPLDLSDFRVLGHVAGRGDVVVDSENWVAGPMSPARIEGIAVQWPNKPRDLVLRYSVRIGGQRPTATELVSVGDYAGSRGRALPLVGANFEIGGAGARGHQLLVDAIFLGSPQMRVTGQRAVITGPTGRETLVGLRVRVEAVEGLKQVERVGQVSIADANYSPSAPQQQPPAAVASVERTATMVDSQVRNAPKRPSRVRVFRSNSRVR